MVDLTLLEFGHMTARLLSQSDDVFSLQFSNKIFLENQHNYNFVL